MLKVFFLVLQYPNSRIRKMFLSSGNRFSRRRLRWKSCRATTKSIRILILQCIWTIESLLILFLAESTILGLLVNRKRAAQERLLIKITSYSKCSSRFWVLLLFRLELQSELIMAGHSRWVLLLRCAMSSLPRMPSRRLLRMVDSRFLRLLKVEFPLVGQLRMGTLTLMLLSIEVRSLLFWISMRNSSRLSTRLMRTIATSDAISSQSLIEIYSLRKSSRKSLMLFRQLLKSLRRSFMCVDSLILITLIFPRDNLDTRTPLLFINRDSY